MHRWQFKSRFRRGAFGWRSQPAEQRVHEAVREILKVARADPALAAEGAVSFLERVSPALEHVDSSSGALGHAVNVAMAELAPIVGQAPADAATHDEWLERLWVAHVSDGLCYLDLLGGHWGELCPTPEAASAWADRLLPEARQALRPRDVYRYTPLHAVGACLSALYRAGRYEDMVELGRSARLWDWQRWVVKALVAQGEPAEAVQYADSCRDPRAENGHIDAVCEEILLSAGLSDEAYRRYATSAALGTTYLARFRAVARKYPDLPRGQILRDLAASTPGREGKWFAAAKSAGLYDEALALAAASPCDPKTLTRAARDLAGKRPAFALEAALLALHWLVEGYGYEVTWVDVDHAYTIALNAAESLGVAGDAKRRIDEMLAREKPGGFVRKSLALRERIPRG